MNPTTEKTITVADLRDDTGILHHAATCDNPDLQIYTGKFGDQMVSCRSCRKFRPVARWMMLDPAQLMQTPPEPPEPEKRTPPPSGPPTGWVCRTHQDQTVRPDGRGCGRCHNDKMHRRAKPRRTESEEN